MHIYRCNLCGNIVVKLVEGGGTLSCCGAEMVLLTANVTDASQEKHVPDLRVEGDTLHVQVGSVAHPMTAEHYIQVILVAQGMHVQYQKLAPGDAPVFSCKIDPEKPVEVYEYCNLHGLWKAEK